MPNPLFRIRAIEERRQFLKYGVVSGIAGAATGLLQPGLQKVYAQNSGSSGSGSSGSTSSTPFLQPFLDPLPIPSIKQPATARLVPAPDKIRVAGEAGRLPHEAWEKFEPKVF